MKLVAKYRFSYMSNSTKYVTNTPGGSRWVNPRWPPRCPLKPINGYNFCSMADSFTNIVAKYRFLSISNSSRRIKITYNMSKWVKSRWLPRWPPGRPPRWPQIRLSGLLLESTKIQHLLFRLDCIMKVHALYRFTNLSFNHTYH